MTLKQKGFKEQSAPSYLRYPRSENADMSLGNHADGLGKMHLLTFLFTTQKEAGSFCFCPCVSGLPTGVLQMCAIR